MLADFDQLAVGFFVSPANGNLEHRNGGPTGMDVLNVRFATAETFRVWGEVPVAEVWQWVALATFRDPSPFHPRPPCRDTSASAPPRACYRTG